MGLIIRLLYHVLDPERAKTTDKDRADWLSKHVLEMDDQSVPQVYGMCSAYSHVCNDSDSFKALAEGAAGNVRDLRKTMLSVIKDSLDAGEHRCTLHCAKCKTGLDLTTTIVQDSMTGKIFCVTCRFGKKR